MKQKNCTAKVEKKIKTAKTEAEKNAVSYASFKIEKDAKNQAYYFILSNGLLDQFAAFCRNYHSDNPHRDCVNHLISEIK
ncbi:MAG: hypothetical protein LBC68_13345 [Prevotellaceae bacterium]|jgi:hypothetical protein|nr:hypothetical protein [Prevotellaceae bacterium]